jgi:flagellar basal-body rod protein FlgG
MSRRVLVSAVLLLVGGGIGFAACWFARPSPAAVAAPEPPAGEEVVVEIRVKLPPGAVQTVGAHHSASSLQQNALLNTSQPYDLAIEGQGFFQVLMHNGETGYTRDGSFGVNPAGVVVDREMRPLTPAITIPQDAVNLAVGADGQVSVVNPTGQASVVGQIRLVRFPNPGWLRHDDLGKVWVATDEAGVPSVGEPGVGNFGLVRQGFRERQAQLDAVMLTDLVRQVVQEQRAQVRVER